MLPLPELRWCCKIRWNDEVAYVRFASVYRQFGDINTFMDELKSLLNSKS